MLNVLAFLLLIASVISLAVFLILWLVKALIKSPYSKKRYAFYSSSSFILIVVSIIIGVATNDPKERIAVSYIANSDVDQSDTEITNETEVNSKKQKEARKEDEAKEKALLVKKQEEEIALLAKKEEQALADKKAEENEKVAKLKAEQEAQKKVDTDNRTRLDNIIADLVKTSEGAIKSIRPTSGDDWIAAYVVLDNSWYLLSQQEKEYLVNEMGPTLSSIVVASAVTDYCDIHFIDENGNKLASPKMFGGYKMH